MTRSQYVLTLERGRLIGYWATFGCHYPDRDFIDWTVHPAEWRLTVAGARRWARRMERRHGALPAAMAERIVL